MTLLSVSASTATGFYTTPIAGTGRDAANVVATQTVVAQAQALAEAIAKALEQARAQGLTAFRPADASVLALPAGLSAADRDALFLGAVGRSYAGSELTLAQWSDALRSLEHRAGATASTLSADQGGGIRNVHGTWYVNGRAWSLAEVYTANRVNTYAELDTLLAASLNVIAANNEATKALTVLMKNLFKKYEENKWEDYKTVNANWVDTVGNRQPSEGLFWSDGNALYYDSGHPESFVDGPAQDRPVSFNSLLNYANQYVGPNSMIKKMADLGTNILSTGLYRADFRALIDEIETIIGAKSSDNQVAALRNEAIMNSRSAIIEGLGTFLKGQQTMGSTTARNA